MNQGEKICRGNEGGLSCFGREIPHRFDSAGRNNTFCSFNFPAGYSIYVEEFILNESGPDNFVLLDGKPLQYSPKLEWGDRRRIFWDALDSQALKENALRRSNIPCVKSLKVLKFKIKTLFLSLKSFYRAQNDILRFIQEQSNFPSTYKFHHIVKKNPMKRIIKIDYI